MNEQPETSTDSEPDAGEALAALQARVARRKKWDRVTLVIIFLMLVLWGVGLYFRNQLRAEYWSWRLRGADSQADRDQWTNRLAGLGGDGLGAALRLTRHERAEVRACGVRVLTHLVRQANSERLKRLIRLAEETGGGGELAAELKLPGGDAILLRLRELLDDADSEVQFEALSGVLELRDDGALEKLAEVARDAERSRVRAQAVAVLARIEISDRALKLLWQVLGGGPDANVAAQALDSLRYYQLDGTALLGLLAWLDDVREVTIQPASDAMNAMLMAQLQAGKVLPPELLAPATSQPETQPDVMTVADYAVRLLRRQTGQYFGYDARADESARKAAILRWRDFLSHRGA